MKLNHLPKTLALTAALLTSAAASPPVQIASLGAGAVWLTAGRAMGANTIPGVGTVIKRKPGDSTIAKGKSDKNGAVVFLLKPGDYSITVGDNKPQDFVVHRGETGIKVVVTGTEHEYVGHVTLLR